MHIPSYWLRSQTQKAYTIHLAYCFQDVSMLWLTSMFRSFLCVNNIPLCGYSNFVYSIDWLMYIWGLFLLFWWLWKMLLWTFMYKFYINMYFQFYWIYLGVELLGHLVTTAVPQYPRGIGFRTWCEYQIQGC